MPIPKVSLPKSPKWSKSRFANQAEVAKFKDMMKRGLAGDPVDPKNMGADLPPEVKADPNDPIASEQYDDVPSYEELEAEFGKPSNASTLESHFQRQFVPQGSKDELGEAEFNDILTENLLDYDMDYSPTDLLVERWADDQYIAPEKYGQIQEGSDAFVMNPHELDEARYGTQAANEILDNVVDRNKTSAGGSLEGMPDVDPDNPLANLLDDFIYSPYDYDSGALGAADINKRIVTGSVDALPHEGNHMATLDGVPGQAVGSHAGALKLFNSNDPSRQRGVWLNPSTSLITPLGTHKELSKAGQYGYYFNTYPEMLAEARKAKFDRIYGPDAGPRDNSRAGDMEVLQQIIDDPQTDGEKAISAVRRNINDKEGKRYDEMWYRLGDIRKGLLDGHV